MRKRCLVYEVVAPRKSADLWVHARVIPYPFSLSHGERGGVRDPVASAPAPPGAKAPEESVRCCSTPRPPTESIGAGSAVRFRTARVNDEFGESDTRFGNRHSQFSIAFR